ncbi:MAG: hypothetical protein ACREBV_10195, partial [Candidatus Zixiibacteriota bacterium]
MKFTNRIKTNSQVWPWLILGLTTLSILPVISVKSSTPQLISYQALITDPSGEPINQTVNIEFKIWNQPSGGTLVWTEMHNSMQITDGKLSVLLGSFTPLNSSILQDTGLYLGVKVGVDPEIFP